MTMTMKQKMKERRASSIRMALESDRKAKEANSENIGSVIKFPLPDLVSPPLASETVLEDDYPIYAGYVYIFDGKVKVSPLTGSCERVKRQEKVKEIRRCDLVERNIT